MAQGDYTFSILVTCLLILALQIHNPFQPRHGACKCDGAGTVQEASKAAGSARPTALSSQQQREAEPLPVYRRQAAPAGAMGGGGGLSTDQLLRELDQVKGREQAVPLTAAGGLPPASLQQADVQAAGSRRVALPPAMSPPQAVPQAGSGAGAVMLQRRDDFGRFLSTRQPRGGLGVVLGVGHGDFALRLLAEWTVSQGVYLVDPYIHTWRGYDDPANVDDRQHQLIYEDLRNRLVQYEGRYVLVRDFSHSFAETYYRGGQTPGPPSFVYVDANPAEEAITRDLELWWQLLASGGILAGGSYADTVRSVVDRFATKQSLQVYTTQDDATPSWFFLKP